MSQNTKPLHNEANENDSLAGYDERKRNTAAAVVA